MFRASNTVKNNKPRWPSRKWIWAIQTASTPVNSLMSPQNKLSKHACCWLTMSPAGGPSNRASCWPPPSGSQSPGWVLWLSWPPSPLPQCSFREAQSKVGTAWLSPTLSQQSLTQKAQETSPGFSFWGLTAWFSSHLVIFYWKRVVCRWLQVKSFLKQEEDLLTMLWGRHWLGSP